MSIGKRIALARKKNGLSLRKLAAAINQRVSAQAIGKYEREEMYPSSEVLIALSNALQTPLEFFLVPASLGVEELEFRKPNSTSSKERAQVEAMVVDQVSRYLAIERILGVAETPWSSPMPSISVTTNAQAEQIADRLRGHWDLGHDPISDLTELLEEKGIKVMLLDLPERVPGLTGRANGPGHQAVPVLVVNRSHSLERRRSTLAYELGHLLIEGSDGNDSDNFVERFASALLMPAAHLRELVGVNRSGLGRFEILSIKRTYRVSAISLLTRLRDLGILSDARVRRTLRTIGRPWKKAEPSPIEPISSRGSLEAPQRFQRLCFQALAEDLISENRTAELLRCPLTEIETGMWGEADVAGGPL